jgi:proteic killer suppression protein
MQKARRVHRGLAQLNVAHAPALMNGPGLNFHALKGDLKGLFAVSVTANYRIIFAFEGEDATDVDLVDYH